LTFGILLVDDDVLVARTLRRMLPADVIAKYTSSKAKAIEFLRDGEQACGLALIDVRLGNEGFAGLDVLDIALHERPNIACALVTGSRELEVLRRAFSRNVPVVPKPFAKSDLAQIVERSRPAPSRDPLEDCIELRASAWGLSPRQREVLRILVVNKKRAHEETARAMGMNLNTLRSHIRELLERSQLPSVDDVIETLLRDSLALARSVMR
jgi:FixJ family two-component response regulator